MYICLLYNIYLQIYLYKSCSFCYTSKRNRYLYLKRTATFVYIYIYQCSFDFWNYDKRETGSVQLYTNVCITSIYIYLQILYIFRKQKRTYKRILATRIMIPRSNRNSEVGYQHLNRELQIPSLPVEVPGNTTLLTYFQAFTRVNLSFALSYS